ncbi:hypothetical protein SODG_006278 [Sodalis praecaptivus]
MIAFARQEGAKALIVIVPRLLFDSDADSAASRPSLRWSGTEIALPAALAHRHYREVFSQQELTLTDRINLASIDETSLFLLLKESDLARSPALIPAKPATNKAQLGGLSIILTALFH